MQQVKVPYHATGVKAAAVAKVVVSLLSCTTAKTLVDSACEHRLISIQQLQQRQISRSKEQHLAACSSNSLQQQQTAVATSSNRAAPAASAAKVVVAAFSNKQQQQQQQQQQGATTIAATTFSNRSSSSSSSRSNIHRVNIHCSSSRNIHSSSRCSRGV